MVGVHITFSHTTRRTCCNKLGVPSLLAVVSDLLVAGMHTVEMARAREANTWEAYTWEGHTQEANSRLLLLVLGCDSEWFVAAVSDSESDAELGLLLVGAQQAEVSDSD